LVSYNPIYGAVFNNAWVEGQLADLRPEFYASAFRAWQDAEEGQNQGFLLRGQALEEAEVWARGKRLSDVDEQFLRESREFERFETSQQLAATEEANAILVEAQQTAKQRIKIGSIILVVTLFTAGLTASWAAMYVNDANIQIAKTEKKTQELTEKTQNDANEKINNTKIVSKKLTDQADRDVQRMRESAEKIRLESESNINEAISRQKESELKVQAAEVKVQEFGYNLQEQSSKLSSISIDLRKSEAKYTEKKNNLQDIWKFSEGEASRQIGDYEKALKILNEIIKDNPRNNFALISRGFTHGAKGNYAEAEADIRAALQVDDQDSGAYRNLGAALDLQNKLDEAIAAYRKAIEINPKSEYAYNGLGYVFRKQNKLDEAIAAYRKAIEINPKFDAAYYNLGIVLNDQNKLDEAVVSLRKAIEINPKSDVAYNYLGSMLLNQNKLDEAISTYRKAIEVNPKSDVAYNGICWTGSLAGKAQDILSDCEKSVELASPLEKDWNRDSRGLARAITGNISGAIEDFQAYLKWLDTSSSIQDSEKSKYRVKRRRWIEELRAGKPPSEIFTREVLEELRKE